MYVSRVSLKPKLQSSKYLHNHRCAPAVKRAPLVVKASGSDIDYVQSSYFIGQGIILWWYYRRTREEAEKRQRKREEHKKKLNGDRD